MSTGQRSEKDHLRSIRSQASSGNTSELAGVWIGGHSQIEKRFSVAKEYANPEADRWSHSCDRSESQAFAFPIMRAVLASASSLIEGIMLPCRSAMKLLAY